ncbi:pimeloyl-ACP methyl ester carboxylesterase [Litorimonas taeanensis]|uniref:Pimeloyl-ACP methyl ester carboxylesterase n=1 Tax=Litorimonas taeanensis TaxID=568099 RepID=A0A420WM72_9PROT|nr:alpha/beta hydrolase [Litorimonas taeanensis]RKQ71985.1 pimeloyl-ACP methyl ester carboxylesterase [Litorimonas taeanensis]
MSKLFKAAFYTGLISLAACTTVLDQSFIEAQAPGTIKRSFVEGNYGQAHVRVAKPQNNTSKKTPLVLLHPTPYSSQTYIPFIEAMRSDRLIIAIDTPGYGDSTGPETAPSMQDYADNALKVLEELGIHEPVDVIGYHTGTLIGVEMAIIAPDRVNKMVLAGVPVYAPHKLPELHKKYAKPDIIELDGSHLISKWEFAKQTMKGGLSLEAAQDHFNDYMQSMPNSTQAYYTVFSYPGYERLPLISVPVLYVAIKGSLESETLEAHNLTPNSEYEYLEHITTGLFDVAYSDMAMTSQKFLDGTSDKQSAK